MLTTIPNTYSPYYLTFRQNPHLPLDVMLQIVTDLSKGNCSEYLESWKKGTEDVFALALKNSTTRKTKDVESKIHSGPCLGDLKSGDHVLIRRLTQRGGSGRLRYFWEQDIAKVAKRHDSGMTYRVEFVKEPGKIRILHGNMLVLIGHIVETVDQLPNIYSIKSVEKNNYNTNLKTTDPQQ